MKKELEIVINRAYVVTECWTFQRMAIIQTAPYAEDWIASHMELYVDCCLSAHFGVNFNWYRPSYFNDVLKARSIDLNKIDETNVIDVIKECINNGEYVLLYIGDSLNTEDSDVHEVLIYGYDDETEQFFAPMLNDRKFVSTAISYSYIQSQQQKIKKTFLDNPGFTNEIALNYHWPMTAYSLQENYPIDNCVHMAIDKIYKEYYGTISTVSLVDDKLEVYNAPNYYTGTGCIKALETALLNEIQEKEFSPLFPGLTKFFKIMHEHRCMLHISMKYIQKKWSIPDELVLEHINLYEKCCEKYQIWYYMALKYEQTGDKSILQRILSELFFDYTQERKALRGVFEVAKTYSNDGITIN